MSISEERIKCDDDEDRFTSLQQAIADNELAVVTRLLGSGVAPNEAPRG